MAKINLAVIGYRRHASRHIQYYRNHPRVKKLVVYHPTNKSHACTTTTNLSEVLACDGIIISSPTHTHLGYIEFLHSNLYRGAVYLEKPGFSTHAEADRLRAISDSRAPLNIIIGYHERYSQRTKAIINALNEFDTGHLLRVSMLNSKGISYRDFFANDWRSKDKKSIAHTLVGHHLSIFLSVTNEIYRLEQSDFNVQIFQNPENKRYDAVRCTKQNCYPLLDSFNSWGMPLKEEISIMCTNCIIEANEKTIMVYHPRDTYDKDGFFRKPDIKSIVSLYEDELSGIQDHFIDQIMSAQDFCTTRLKEDIAIGQIALDS
jgi:predicted dehydrogenase